MAPFTDLTSPSGTEVLSGGVNAMSGKPSNETVEAIRTANLTHPAGASRVDMMMETGPMPAFNAGSKILTISTGAGSKLITGGARLSKGTSYTMPGTSCKAGGATKTQTSANTSNALWTNSSKSLTANMAVGGSFFIKNGMGAMNAGGSYNHQTYS